MTMEEADCPCSDLGKGEGRQGPLTDVCGVGDVVVIVLPEVRETE
jgi:hypothetical protein